MSNFKILKNLLLVLLVNNTFSNLLAKELIKGNGEGVTFNFSVNNIVYNPIRSLCFISSQDTIDKNNYSLAYLGIPGMGIPNSKFKFNDKFIPLAPEKVKLNNELDQDNPLYGAAIKYIDIMGNNNLIAIKEDDLNIIYLVELSKGPEDISVYSFKCPDNLRTIGLGTNFMPSIKNVQQEVGYIAVSNNEDRFDGDGSGILVLKRDIKKVSSEDSSKEDDKESNVPKEIVDSGLMQVGGIYPISKNSTVLKINSNLSFVKKSFCVEPLLFKAPLEGMVNPYIIYFGFKVSSGINSNDGSKAVAIGSFDNRGQLNLISIAPDSVFDGEGQIVGGLNQEININKIKSLITSTHLPYLVVVKDDNKVFSLPIVNDMNVKNGYGQLANVNKDPLDKFSEKGRFIARVFNEAARSPKDVYTENSIPAKVGGNIKLSGVITDIRASNDTVYVSVNSGGSDNTGGIFYSRALFDSKGKVKLWTDWLRTSGISQDTDHFVVDIPSSTTWSICSNDKQSVNKTFWSNGSSNIEKYVLKNFPSEQRGVVSVINLPYKSSNRILESLTLATGFNKVLALELSSNNSALQDDDVSKLILWNAESDVSLGTITSADILSTKKYNYLVIGGIHGLSILSNIDGSGLLKNQEITKEALESMNFTKISDLKNITKLSSVDNKLYVLTPTELKCFIFNNNRVISEKIIVESQSYSRFNYFTDLIATPKALFIGSTSGLITYDFSNSEVITLSEGIGLETGLRTPVSKLYAYTSNGFDRDLSNDGNLYVINGYKAWQRSQVYRFHVNGSILKSINDLYRKDITTMFIDLGNYYNGFWSDGAQTYVAKNKSQKLDFDHRGNIFEKKLLDTNLYIFRPEIRSSQRAVYSDSKIPSLNIKDYDVINNISRSFATGIALVSGDFGIRFNG